MKNLWICILFLFTILQSCVGSNRDQSVLSPNYNFPYNLTKSDHKISLANILKEISGLSYYADNLVASIQDELGIIFIVNLTDGKIVKEIKFEKSGDFEGIEFVDGKFWALKSKGDLIRIKNFEDPKKLKDKTHKTALSSKNNAEGLGFDRKNNQLLIACKGSPNHSESNYKNKKAIYAFDLETKELKQQPFLLIDIHAIDSLIQLSKIEKSWAKIVRGLGSTVGDFSFKPSAIAVHPYSNNIYILSSNISMLAVFKPLGELLYLEKLPKEQFHQAEGICFDPQGNLYISNEGGKFGKSNILKFNPKIKE